MVKLVSEVRFKIGLNQLDVKSRPVVLYLLERLGKLEERVKSLEMMPR